VDGGGTADACVISMTGDIGIANRRNAPPLARSTLPASAGALPPLTPTSLHTRPFSPAAAFLRSLRAACCCRFYRGISVAHGAATALRKQPVHRHSVCSRLGRLVPAIAVASLLSDMHRTETYPQRSAA